MSHHHFTRDAPIKLETFPYRTSAEVFFQNSLHFELGSTFHTKLGNEPCALLRMYCGVLCF
jgi:hypothetical protein